jgi:hypothetical protein
MDYRLDGLFLKNLRSPLCGTAGGNSHHLPDYAGLLMGFIPFATFGIGAFWAKLHQDVDQTAPRKTMAHLFRRKILQKSLARGLDPVGSFGSLTQEATARVAAALSSSKVDGFVPHTQHVNLRIVSQPE